MGESHACAARHELWGAPQQYSVRNNAASTVGPAIVARERLRSRGLVLVFDTDRCDRQRTANALEQDGWNVAVGGCPAAFCAGFEHIAEVRACLLELCPDGRLRLDHLSLLRQYCPQARIVVVTAYPSFRAAVTAIRLGADDYAVKPITEGELTRILTGVQEFDGESMSLPSLQRVEWEYINRVLGHTDGNISAAARLLGVERSTLQRKLRKRPPTR